MDIEPTEEQQDGSQKQNLKIFFRDAITIIVIAGVIILGLQAVIQKFIVDGPSMNYTLHTGEQLIVNKIVYNIHEPERGDIIVFHPPLQMETDDYIKRIIGLPGEIVHIKDGVVTIEQPDGAMLVLDEPYVTNIAKRDYDSGVIPEGEYFVMGDNRTNSSDSRNGWTLDEESIIGKGWVAIWPISDWGLIPNHDFSSEEE